ncbi:cell-cycle control medial ring component-domain-containing protein [Truncatella angustata]|uniref:Cell-cycle control medial ring component-domain-containing protein n=1 Tax=Truncatella angustata TaxID=152316 RepID=A0A9P8RHJ5_9PEZI|nr:cell-cycle control medial ring component-domain-containing protein [Truncatella angustata]KAH6645972.1 cell-cycle control medial ring component-domain-containing protein [Truncatella angustata]
MASSDNTANTDATTSDTPTLYSSYPFPHHTARQLANMTEVTFAKQFLATLDARPVKLSPDHVEDPRGYPARNAYILPRAPRPMSKPNSRGAPGSERSLRVTLKSLRNPPLDIKLTSQPLSTSVLDLKQKVVEESGVPLEKIKLLYKKKPVVDSKILKELVGEDDGASVEFSVMVLGGAAAAAKKPEEAPAADVAQGASGTETLESGEFWDDLKGFLLQRVRDERQASDLFETFQAAYKSKR